MSDARGVISGDQYLGGLFGFFCRLMRQHWPFAILLPLVAVAADEVFVSPSFAFAPFATVAIFIGAIIFLGFLLSAAIRESKVPAA